MDGSHQLLCGREIRRIRRPVFRQLPAALWQKCAPEEACNETGLINPYGLITARKYVRIAARSESSYDLITDECRQSLPSVNLTEPGSALRCTGGADVRS